jgi:hypothetical protein
MSPDAQTARDDLAFLKALVSGAENIQWRSCGESYLAAGLIYGGQMILHAVQAAGLLPNTPPFALGIGLGPSLVFVFVLSWIIYRNRGNAARGATGRAIGSIFGAIGLANLFLIAVIGSVAVQLHSIQVWLIYPCCIFVLQGTAWLFTFMMRRKGWHLAVAFGFFATAVAGAIAIPSSIGLFILFLGIGMWGCMALPGWLILRNTKAAG